VLVFDLNVLGSKLEYSALAITGRKTPTATTAMNFSPFDLFIRFSTSTKSNISIHYYRE
jgi:hypothetical protein